MNAIELLADLGLSALRERDVRMSAEVLRVLSLVVVMCVVVLGAVVVVLGAVVVVLGAVVDG
jgi:hypothetical protein